MVAENKKSFIENIDKFTSGDHLDASIVFEVYTETEDETEALKIMCILEESASENAKQIIKNVIGDKGIKVLKNFLKG